MTATPSTSLDPTTHPLETPDRKANPMFPSPSSRPVPRARRILPALLLTAAFLLAACGSEPIPISAPASAESAAGAPGDAAGAVPVGVGSSDLGDILVDTAGFSLYGFTEDVDGVPTCEGGCAGAWPPILVTGTDLPAGLDPAVFSVVPRPDGTNQLKAGKWPLYLFAGDTAAGQTSGHESGDVWFLVRPDGTLIGVEEPAAPAPVADESADTPAQDTAVDAPATTALAATGSTSIGDVLVSGAGLTLYGFTNDVDGDPTCEGGCAEAWPPILVADPALVADLDPEVFSLVARPDGSAQLKAGKWPLYLFAGDTAPGQTTGHLSGDVWFAVAPDGSLIDGPAPAQEPAAAEGSTAQAENAAAQAADPAAVTVAETEFGRILVDGEGFSLYGFGNDFGEDTSTCVDGCAQAWPPVLVDSADLPVDLDPEQFSVVARPDGTWQLKSGIWPLYRFGGDTEPGQTTGHLSGDVWFLAAADGKLVGFVPPAAEADAAAQPAPTAPPAPPAPAPTATPVPPAPTPAPVQPTYGSGNSGYGSGNSGSGNSGYGSGNSGSGNSGYGSGG